MKPTLYKFHLINRHGYVMYERYVVASGVNEAKRVLRQSSKYYKDVKIKIVESSDVLIALPQPTVKETREQSREQFFKRWDEAWEKDFGIKYTK
jgi:hypothetical protein